MIKFLILNKLHLGQNFAVHLHKLPETVYSSLFEAHTEERVQGLWADIQSLLWDCCRLPSLPIFFHSAVVASHFTYCNPSHRSKMEDTDLPQDLN